MKKKYVSPEFVFSKIDFIENILNVSTDQGGASGGSGGGLGNAGDSGSFFNAVGNPIGNVESW